MGFLKTTFFALLLFQAIITAQAQRNDCPSRLCGQNTFEVRFPFRLQGQQPQSCGYPGFDLRCTSHKSSMALLINLPNSGEFYVRYINYLSQEIQLYAPNNCLLGRLLSFNLSDTPFTAVYSEDYTLLSCPSESVASTRFTKISCLSNLTASVVATLASNLVRPNLDMCSVIATLSVPFSWSHDDDLNDQVIQLTWGVPNCEGCEARGGVCGFENSTSDQILCFTDHGTDNSRGSKIFKIIALSIVVPAFTCSICISCFACIVGRRATQHLATIAPPPSPPPPIAGLDDSTIESYAKVVLGESRRLPGPNGATCPICLVDYHPKETVRCIPQCEHCFHSDCIDEWLRLNGSCPVCRNSPSPARADL